MIKITPRVEMMFGSDWVDVSEDVVTSVRADWGIHDSGPTARVAEPGTMSFSLDNSANNSGGVRGYYSPDHASARVGFTLGTPVRLVLNNELLGDKVKWVGTIFKITPKAGVRSPVTAVECHDWMELAARAKLSGLAVQVDIQSDDLFELLVNAMDIPPPGGVRIGSGSDVYPYALDNTQDEKSHVVSEFQKLAMSEFGIIHVSAGELVFEGRRLRGGGGLIRIALDEDEDIIELPSSAYDADGVINRAQVAVHPRRRDSAATTILFNLGAPVQILRGTSVTINCPYRDPNQQAERVGGIDMVTPVPTTDYTFTQNKDGSGTDYTSQLTVDADFGGNSAVVTVTNAGPADGWIPSNGLKLRGRGLYDFEPVISDRRDTASAEAYGEIPLNYDMPYQSSPSNASDLSLFILSLYKQPKVRVSAVSFLANWSDTLLEQAFNLEISERISITAPSVALNATPFFVNGCRLDVEMSGLTRVTWDLAPVDTSQFWVLEQAGRTELDETTVLGYGLFVAGWILDSSELGSGTILN